MRTLRIEVDCGEKYCGNCNIDANETGYCNAFTDEKGRLRKLIVDDYDYIRCPECLAAEIKENKA